jgi:hypothetical protein
MRQKTMKLHMSMDAVPKITNHHVLIRCVLAASGARARRSDYKGGTTVALLECRSVGEIFSKKR